ncbi:hypothetical protein L218DRAFT_841806, partial [Marasmius fiardii PR-910]
PHLVVIDGLDECIDPIMQERVLSIIFSTYKQSPFPSLHFLLCSRPEPLIKSKFQNFNNITKHIQLNDSFQLTHDIQLYFDEQFPVICRDSNYSGVKFPTPWPSPADVQLLVQKADGQFIFAIAVMDFIKARHMLPTEQLQTILK